ncbi:MAG: SHOCT domain-containing protein [Clostridiales bacterium]|nr:SHOCT domain-containing protein [Clostridiales bacterium]
MEKQEQILAKADIRKVFSKKLKLYLVIYYIPIFITMIAGFSLDSGYYHSSYFGDDETIIRLGFIDPFYVKHIETGESWFDSEFFIILFAILLGVILLPFLIYFTSKKIQMIQCRNTSLIVSNSRVYGSYNSFIWKKSLEMPIEKVDSLTIISSLIDKFRSGKTIGINSASGTIKISFVQNAEEVVSAAMDKIYEIREFRNVNAAPAAIPEKSDSVSDKLQELVKMKDSGLISDEEFANIRKDILSKM